MITELDSVKLNFNQDGIILLKSIVFLMTLGVSLSLRFDNLRELFRSPKPVIAGLIAQLVLLPALTYLIIIIAEPKPSFALGMILVASCPGGNVSNFFTYLSGGNCALSICMTSISSLCSVFLTPFNILFWGKLYEPTSSIVKNVELSFFSVFLSVFFVIALPLIIGMTIREKRPAIADKFENGLKKFSFVAMIVFVVAALAANFTHFLAYVQFVFIIVLIHNSSAFLVGYSWASLFKLDFSSRKAITLEVGLQNSGIALALIFEFFDGIGGMAIMAAWWGVWHMIGGSTLAYIWSRKK